MDLHQLDQILDDDVGYLPAFNKKQRPTSAKGNLQKNSSAKSLEKPPPDQEKQKTNNFLNAMKEPKKTQVISFEQFFKKDEETQSQKKSSEKNEKSIQKTQPKQLKATFKNNSLSFQADMNQALEEDEPIHQYRKMKPPLNRRFDDNKSSVSHEQKTFNQIDSELSRQQNSKKNLKSNSKDELDPLSAMELQQGKKMKQFLTQQLDFQKESIDKILDEERESHRIEIAKIKKTHEEELQRKLALKDFEIRKMKEYYEMYMKARNERQEASQNFEVMSKQIQENLKVIERMEVELKEANYLNQSGRQRQVEVAKKIAEQNLKLRDKQILDKNQQLEDKEAQFRTEKNRTLSNIDKERQKLQQWESRLKKRENDLEIMYKQKQKALSQDYERRNKGLKEQSSKISLQQMQLEQLRLKNAQQKQLYEQNKKQFQEQKAQLFQQIQLQKSRILTKEIELSSKLNNITIKSNEIQHRENELISKLKLLDLERKRVNIDMVNKQNYGNTKFTDLNAITKTGYVPRSQALCYERSVKEMRDQYLKHLQY